MVSWGSGLGLLFYLPLVISLHTIYVNAHISTHTNDPQHFILHPDISVLCSATHSTFPFGCELDISNMTWLKLNCWYSFQTYYSHTHFFILVNNNSFLPVAEVRTFRVNPGHVSPRPNIVCQKILKVLSLKYIPSLTSSSLTWVIVV